MTKIMAAFGFPHLWLNLIFKCMSTVSYSVVVNACTSQTIHPTCGLRQGDPLSIYLFLFCMEIFSRMMDLGQALGNVKGISVCRSSPKILHLFFADDAFLFYRTNASSCQAIANITKTLKGFALSRNSRVIFINL